MISVASVIDAVAANFHLDGDDIRGPRRMRELVYPRHLAFLVAFDLCKHKSITDIGRAFNRDHTTVIYGIGMAKIRLESDAEMRDQITQIKSQIVAGKFPPKPPAVFYKRANGTAHAG